MMRYCENGALSIDNNVGERMFRRGNQPQELPLRGERQ